MHNVRVLLLFSCMIMSGINVSASAHEITTLVDPINNVSSLEKKDNTAIDKTKENRSKLMDEAEGMYNRSLQKCSSDDKK